MKLTIGSVSVGLGAKNAGDDKLSLREHLTEHAHEGNGATLAKVDGGLAKVLVRGIIDSGGQPLLHHGSGPSRGILLNGAGDVSSVRGILLKNLLELGGGISGVAGGRKPQGDHEGAERAEHVSGLLKGGEALGTGDSKSGPPRPVEEQLIKVLGNWVGALDPSKLREGGKRHNEKEEEKKKKKNEEEKMKRGRTSSTMDSPRILAVSLA